MVGLRAPWGAEGGVESSVSELAPRLAATGIDMTVYCRSRYNPHGNAIREGVRLRDSPTVYGRGSEAFVHSALAVPRAAIHHDIVHIHACGPALFSGVPAWFGRRSVVTLHGMDWTRSKWGAGAKALLRAGVATAGTHADAIITVSAELRDWVAARYPAPVFHIPNGVPPHRPADWDAATFPMLEPGRFLLFIGRLVPEKEIETLLRAAARTHSNLKIVITGGATYTDQYQARLRAEAPSNVVFTGPRFGIEKRMLFSAARGFVLPSRVEGLPIALLEAMAAGLPTLVSDIAPNLEALGDIGGWRLRCGDIAAWARAFEEAEAADPRFLARIGEAGAVRARDTFGWDPVVERTLDIYRQVHEASHRRSILDFSPRETGARSAG